MKQVYLVGSIGSLKATTGMVGTFFALKELGYDVKAMSGASGSTIALPLLAKGMPMDDIITELTKIPSKKILDNDASQQFIDWINPFRKSRGYTGLNRGNSLYRILRDLYTKNACSTFEDAIIPFIVIATEIARDEDDIKMALRDDYAAMFMASDMSTTSKEAIFETGDVIEPIRASTAIPVVFRPQMINGRLYSDGGVVDAIPIEPLIDKFGADCDVIYSDTTSDVLQNRINPKDVKDFIMVLVANGYATFQDSTRSRLLRAKRELKKSGHGIYQVKHTHKISMTDTEKIPEAVKAAYQNALIILPKL